MKAYHAHHPAKYKKKWTKQKLIQWHNANYSNTVNCVGKLLLNLEISEIKKKTLQIFKILKITKWKVNFYILQIDNFYKKIITLCVFMSY